MEIPKNEYIYIEDLIEINIKLYDGRNTIIIAKGDFDIYGVYMSTFYLYSEEEMKRFNLNDLLNKCYCFAMPESDIKADVLFGMLVLKKGEDIVFMERRDSIEDIVVGSDDAWVDLYNEHKSYYLRKISLE